MSSECNPVVGSSNTNNVFPVAFFCNSFANFTLSASPPDKVGALCPNFIYNYYFLQSLFRKKQARNKILAYYIKIILNISLKIDQYMILLLLQLLLGFL